MNVEPPSSDEKTNPVAEIVKNRAKFEWALLGVITTFVTKFFITGEPLPESYGNFFLACLIIYAVIFTLDSIIPVFTKFLDAWAREKPPAWVEATYSLIDHTMSVVDKLPLAVCPYRPSEVQSDTGLDHTIT
jgi:hypothetical protein